MTNPIANRAALRLPRKTEELDLGEYHESLQGQVIHVWVNLTKAMHDRWNLLQRDIRAAAEETKAIDTAHFERVKNRTPKGKEVDRAAPLGERLQARLDANVKEINRINEEIFAWYAEVWSQHADVETHSTPEDVGNFAKQCAEEDPALWQWVTVGTQAKIIAHRNRLVKN